MRPHSLPAESHSFVGMARETAAMPPACGKVVKVGKPLEPGGDTHTHVTYIPSLPPTFFLALFVVCSFGLSLRLFGWFLGLISLLQSRAKYSLLATPIFLSCPFSAALSVVLFSFSVKG